jgi:hypothetical protein
LISHEWSHDTPRSNGVALDWLTFDEEYGKAPRFLAGLCDREMAFVGEVPRSLSCHQAHTGARPDRDDEARPAECVLVAALAEDAVAVRVPREHLADEVWQAAELPVWLREDGEWSARAYRLILAYNARTGEIKYFVSNATALVPLGLLVRVAFRRAAVEQCFEVQKGELGFGHYEGRNYTGLMRHLALCCAAGLFAAERTAGAQKKTTG